MLGILKAIGTTVRAAFRKPVTVEYPDGKEGVAAPVARLAGAALGLREAPSRSAPGCQVCARYCPVDCMTVTMKDNPNFAAGKSKRKKIVDKFYIDYARCMRCDICVEVCNFDAIVMNNTWKGVELSRYDRQDLVMDLPALLQQSKSGELETPFREPMGVAHSGWAPKTEEEHEAAEEGTGPAAAPAEKPGGQETQADAKEGGAETPPKPKA